MALDIEIRRYSEEEVAWWLALHSLPVAGFGREYIEKLVDRFQGPSVWTASKQEIIARDEYLARGADLFIERRKQIDPEALLKQVRATDIDAFPIGDPRYPPALRHIFGPPLVLFFRGQLFEFDMMHTVAMVGTRAATPYGSRLAKDMARDLARAGIVVVSGLAYGIDSLAHWGAIEGGGRTVAVLASGCDLCYPSSNKPLFNKILDGNGAVISEFFPGVKPDKWHFPARNRIVSGISRAVVVVEAAETSGALITAKMGFEQDRDVYAVPGRVDMPSSAGTNALLVETKARPVRNAQDVINGLEWETTTMGGHTTVVELFGREKEVFDRLTNEPTHFDVLCHETGMGAGELSATLTMLELAGIVVRHPGDWFARQDRRIAGPLVP
jgi:DNA processing protein